MTEWTDKATQVYAQTQAALQTVYDELNNGQQQKLLKSQEVKQLFDHYAVSYDS